MNKGVNMLKDHGGWMSFKSFDEAKKYFDENSKPNSIWQPCKACNPE